MPPYTEYWDSLNVWTPVLGPLTQPKQCKERIVVLTTAQFQFCVLLVYYGMIFPNLHCLILYLHSARNWKLTSLHQYALRTFYVFFTDSMMMTLIFSIATCSWNLCDSTKLNGINILELNWNKIWKNWNDYFNTFN